MIWVDGHSDYGHALSVFNERWGDEVTSRTSVLILGDARNNYHASEAWVLEELAAPGPPRLLAQPRAPRLLGLGRLDRRRVRRALRRRRRVPHPAPARALRGRARVTGPDPEASNPERVPPPGVRTTGAASGRPTRVVLVRHGEAVCNVEGVVGGVRGCTGLTELGVRQVRAWPSGWPAPASWPGWPPSTPSVLPRAVQTAEILAPALERWRDGPAARTVERLRPVRAAPRRGRRAHLARVRRARYEVPGLGRRPRPGRWPRGRRAGAASSTGPPPAVTALADAHPGELVVAACHAGVIEATMLRFLPVAADPPRACAPSTPR